jgi:hypothetical protein
MMRFGKSLLLNGKLYICSASLLSTLLGAQQPVPATSESVIVTESRHGIVCDTRCTITQQATATVGDRKLELRLYENKPELLLALGTYPGLRVPGKTTVSYRINESYILTYPDGKTENFEVTGILR